MGLRMCFYIGSRLFTRKICIDIPILYDPFWKLKHPEEVIRDFIYLEDVNKAAINYLVTIATIAELTGTLDNANSKELFQSSINNAVMALDLPSEMSVEYADHVIREQCEQKD